MTNILQPKDEKHDWLGMKTTGQIRAEQGKLSRFKIFTYFEFFQALKLQGD